MTLVSVLIPCHNAAQWVGQAITSALSQLHVDLEVVVIDDGSDDESVASISQFPDLIKFKVNSNRGGNPTRNELLRMAKGDWVQFLDADDYLQPGKISAQLDSLQQSGSLADVIYSPVTTETWRDDRMTDQTAGTIDTNASLEEQWIHWQVAQTGAVLWRREALLAIGGWNEQYPCCQDNEVIFRAIQAGLKFHFCPAAGAVYRIWSEETVCRKDPARVIHYKTQLIDRMLVWLGQQDKMTPAIEAAAGQAFFEMARTWAKYDLATATTYQQLRRRRGWYRPAGPAAPLGYWLAHSLMGFRMAEQIAAWRR